MVRDRRSLSAVDVEMEQLRGQVSSLRGEVSSLSAEVLSLQAENVRLKGKQALCEVPVSGAHVDSEPRLQHPRARWAVDPAAAAQHRATMAELSIIIGGASDRTLAQAAPHSAYFIMKRMHQLGLINEAPNIDHIMHVTPSHVSFGSYTRSTGDMNDMILSEELSHLGCVSFFVLTDAGTKKGSKWSVELCSSYSHNQNRVIERDIGLTKIDGGVSVAGSVCNNGKRVGIGSRWMGACIDNAGDMIATFVAKMTEMFHGFIGCGCVLHILNLVLVNACINAYGDEAMGERSALRVVWHLRV